MAARVTSQTRKRLHLLFVDSQRPSNVQSASQGQVCSDDGTCCHTETEVADQTYNLTLSWYTAIGPVSRTTHLVMLHCHRASLWQHSPCHGTTGPVCRSTHPVMVPPGQSVAALTLSWYHRASLSQHSPCHGTTGPVCRSTHPVMVPPGQSVAALTLSWYHRASQSQHSPCHGTTGPVCGSTHPVMVPPGQSVAALTLSWYHRASLSQHSPCHGTTGPVTALTLSWYHRASLSQHSPCHGTLLPGQSQHSPCHGTTGPKARVARSLPTPARAQRWPCVHRRWQAALCRMLYPFQPAPQWKNTSKVYSRYVLVFCSYYIRL